MAPKTVSSKRIRCCDPLKCHKKQILIGLRVITDEYMRKHNNVILKVGDHICSGCRTKLSSHSTRFGVDIHGAEYVNAQSVADLREPVFQRKRPEDLHERSRPRCCDPFKCHKKLIFINLRVISEDYMRKYSSVILKVGDHICAPCRSKVSSHCTGFGAENINVLGSLGSSESDFTSLDYDLDQLNKSVEYLGESPLQRKRLKRSAKYTTSKLRKVETSVRRKLQQVNPKGVTSESEIIDQLKEKFSSCSRKSEQIQVLTILPKSWSIQRTKREFGVSSYMARKAKQLVEEKGILSIPNPRAGNFPTAVKKDVDDWYGSDEISRIMPGKKDYVSVFNGNERVHVQKRLILCNLKEAYYKFKDNFPTTKIGFSKFAELRPRHCVLAGQTGTHSVCVCTIHQNIKLMMFAARFHLLCAQDEVQLSTYHHCLAAIVCNPSLPECHLGGCTECKNKLIVLKENIFKIFDSNMIDEIQFKEWTSTDRCTLNTMTKSSDEFVDMFCERIEVLKRHDFIAKQQASFFKELTTTLETGECVVIGDFSENYSFVLQDAAQGFHWNNAQATLHPFVSYHRKLDLIEHVSVVIISDCMQHDTIAVHLFQRLLIRYLKDQLNDSLHKIFYFSDGAVTHYKNFKNFKNLCHHEEDFGINAEWHFFATSHGKSVCDGLAGTVKRLATKASLQRPYNQQIMTPWQLYEFCQENIPTVKFIYSTIQDYEKERITLESRFSAVKTLIGTQRLHAFIPYSKHELEVKDFSRSSHSRIASLSTYNKKKQCH